MWASKIRYQAKMKSKITCVHWINGNCSDSADAEDINCGETNCGCGWMVFGGGSGELGVSWIGRGGSSCYGNRSETSSTQSGSLYKSHFNLRGHTGGVGLATKETDRVASFEKLHLVYYILHV